MLRPSRRGFLAASAAGLAARGSIIQASDDSSIEWHDVRDWGLEGRGFNDTEMYFDRLPARAKANVREAVWNLSRHSAGMRVHFRAATEIIHVDHSLSTDKLSMPHMPATGVSGLDLYGKDSSGTWRWISVTHPTTRDIRTELVRGLPGDLMDFTVYLPLYNGTEHLRIGVPKGSVFEPVAPRTEKPIVFYGTSITHGACASRPGMPHPAILGRRLDRPVINLGFSGNGKMEKEVGQYLTELNASVFVIDCLPNMDAAEITQRTVPLVQQLRAAHPTTPVVLVEDRSYSGSWVLSSQKRRNESSREALRGEYRKLLDSGVTGLHYIDGESLLGADRDDTTDGSHPSDLGFLRHADAMESVIRSALSS